MSKAWPVAGIDPAGTLAENARIILGVRTAEFFSYTAIVDREDAVEELHALRIAAKRLRYTLELFHDVFGAPGERLIDTVKAMQEELGEVHDHDVRLDLIAAEIAGVAAEDDDSGSTDSDPRTGLIALAARETAGRGRHYQAFRTLWARHAAQMRASLVGLSAMTVPDAVAERRHTV